MKPIGIFLLSWCCTTGSAATSEILFPLGGATFPGAAGNVAFDGQRFVTPAVQTNGAITLVGLNTNGVVISNPSLGILGNTPRIGLAGSNCLLAWLDTNSALSALKVGALSNGALSNVFIITTNVANESVSLNSRGAHLLAVWQSADSNSAVFARGLNAIGEPLDDAFAVAPSAQPQLYPSVDGDGTNQLVCWVEQNVASNDWRTVGRFISNGVPTGVAFSVSDTNSLLPHPTACSYGTNYLVAWSWDYEFPGSAFYFYHVVDPNTNYWKPIIRGRILSPVGSPQSNSFVVARNPFMNTNPAVAFGDSSYLVSWVNWNGAFTNESYLTSEYHAYPSTQRLQRLSADGTSSGYPFPAIVRNITGGVRCTFGSGLFCVLYANATNTSVVMVGHDSIAPPRLVNLRRNGNGIAVDSSMPVDFWDGALQISTNFVDWLPLPPNHTNTFFWSESELITFPKLPTQTNFPRLFVRQINKKWQCIEQLRALDWAKQQWSWEKARINPGDTPTDTDVFWPNGYVRPKPDCPHAGSYVLQDLGRKPLCCITGHTL